MKNSDDQSVKTTEQTISFGLSFPEGYTLQKLSEQEDAELAALIRKALKEHDLDKPGTVYYDPQLDHLSAFYGDPVTSGEYFVLKDEAGNLAGGCGYAAYAPIENCAELQKLYLFDAYKGQKLGWMLLKMAEVKAREAGYSKACIETHSNLQKAIALYRKNGFEPIDRPASVSHDFMDCFLLKAL